VLEPEVDSVRIFLDTERRGNWWNLWRCMDEMLTTAGVDEPILITCDDVITISGWREYWEHIHSLARNDIYTFMSRQRHLFKDENLKRGYVTKCQARGYYDHAVVFINQQGLMKDIEEWFDAVGRKTIPLNRQKWLDVVIQDYLIYKNKPWTLTTPTLFDHIGEISSLGNNVGGSVKYIGDL